MVWTASTLVRWCGTIVSGLPYTIHLAGTRTVTPLMLYINPLGEQLARVLPNPSIFPFLDGPPNAYSKWRRVMEIGRSWISNLLLQGMNILTSFHTGYRFWHWTGRFTWSKVLLNGRILKWNGLKWS
ncbi:hypothetical protein AVEN_51404-1 [Araneus ventricosus]|uniref:Uncharacterized protein n=1 Tax=Araneus ventricosus TaxID=182803 RepID=A0A4Y2PPE1_ARAVE|nr:hypothetical protein AVEN_51404-1 [Araneus ventricosus]